MARQSIQVIVGTDQEGSKDLRKMIADSEVDALVEMHIRIIMYNIICMYHIELQSLSEDIRVHITMIQLIITVCVLPSIRIRHVGPTNLSTEFPLMWEWGES